MRYLFIIIGFLIGTLPSWANPQQECEASSYLTDRADCERDVGGGEGDPN